MPDMLRHEAAQVDATQAVPLPTVADDEPTPALIDSYVRSIYMTESDDAASQIVDDRLNELKRAAANRSAWQTEDWAGLIDSLTQYAFQVVRSWLAIIAVGDRAEEANGVQSRLVGEDVDQLAENIVSRAENGFLEELGRIRWWLEGERPDMKLLHLVECALQLPDAYRSWQLRHHHTVSEDELEDLALVNPDAGDQVWPLRRLYQALTQEHDRIIYLLQTLRYSEGESAEIVEASLNAFELVLRKGDSR